MRLTQLKKGSDLRIPAMIPEWTGRLDYPDAIGRYNMFRLLLPVLFPSWRFFSSIGPSPRIEYAFLQNEQDAPVSWHAFRPRPSRLSLGQQLRRLLWNPHWNETLYINSCAERLFDQYSDMRAQEIMRRMLVAANSGEIAIAPGARYLVYRISAVIREGDDVTQPVLFSAKPALLRRVA